MNRIRKSSPQGRTVIGSLNRSATLTVLAMLAPVAANGATIYSQTFGTGSGDANFASIGWSAYRNNGDDLTSATAPSLAYIAPSSALLASSGSAFTTHIALVSNAGTIDPTAYGNDLTISFTENATDAGTASPEMGWRVLAQVGSAIYASDFIGFTAAAATTTHTINVADAIWRVWSGESDLSDGFIIANISGSAGNLAAGSITNIGILAIDGNGNNDRLRLFDFTITATPIPEPRAAFLGGLGLLALLRRRR